MIQDGQAGKRMAVTCFIIIEVMGRSDLDRAGAEFPIDQDGIADHGIVRVVNGNAHVCRSGDCTVVFRMHGDRRIPEQGLWPRRGYGRRRAASSSSGYSIEYSFPFVSSCSTSISDRAVRQRGHQLMSRSPR